MKVSIRKNNRTILTNIMVSMMIIFLIQTILFISAIYLGGAYKNLDNSAFENLEKISMYRMEYVQKEKNNKWVNINHQYLETIDNIDEVVKKSAKNYNDLINGDDDLCVEVINSLTNSLINTINYCSVTGSFIVFGDESINSKYGLYLTDTNTNTIISGYSDIRVEIAPLNYQNSLDLVYSSYMTYQFKYNTFTDQQRKFFSVPIETKKANPNLTFNNCGWWSDPFYILSSSDIVYTYTVPLINSDNLIYGVFGIEISVKHMRELLNPIELDSSNKSHYFYTRLENNQLTPENTVATGVGTTQFKKSETLLDIIDVPKGNYSKTSFENLYSVNVREGKYYLAFNKIKMYDNNTPFSNDEWYIVAIVPATVVHAPSNRLQTTVFITITVSILLCLTLIALISYYITSPIRRLTMAIKKSNSYEDLDITKTKITEIDELYDTIQVLNKSVIESSAKLSNIIDLVDLSIVAFEINYRLNSFYTSKNINEFLLLDYEEKSNIEKYASLFDELEKYRLPTEESTYKYVDKNGTTRYIEIKYINSDSKDTTTGLFLDVTKDYLEKENLLYERNIDLLTGIFNRRAFFDELNIIFSDPESIKIGALIMVDIDDLKFVNDTYGHDYGDEFIRLTARTINEGFKKITKKVCGRRSGDEFFIFIYGFDNLHDIDDSINELLNTFKTTYSIAPNEQKHYIRSSIGLSIYPNDSTDYHELIKFADYAMYEIKNSSKGEFKYYDQESYSRNSYMVQNKEDLNTLIEKELVDFHFQPIVDVKTAEIIGYEGLMRSKMASFKSPIEILNVARSQFKLNKIEQLTFNKAIEKYSINRAKFKNRKLFINSIANQMITDSTVSDIENKYGDILKNIVIEFTEHEKTAIAFVEQKCNLMRRWSGEVALDDYGTGFNSELSLLESNPNYVKIDISLVRGVHTDPDRYQMITSIVNYTKKRGIKTIAEGVEYPEELKTLMSIGCDYVQGYVIAKPNELPQDLPEAAIKLIEKLNKN